MRTNYILIEKEIVDKIIIEMKEFENFTNYKNYEQATLLLSQINTDIYNKDLIFNIIWRSIKINKSNKRIYRILKSLGYIIDGLEEDNED